ncbi:hypothetical protein ASE01_23390 [Nocardioides sp. Root190]|uniref:LysM peptidoglycan-binding domain-containing protein n=1 Tax=Nocardioides sp. Root190 TaxID=1736488 RepID=UPI0006FB985C|nr:LysM domain-containing protein [Nocardioides sp. Root190]KRB79258.1 hypothetical protein ASE01_23390 [Nocardioides sp. Root190]
MNHAPSAAVRSRAALLWLAVSAAAGTLLTLAAPFLAPLAGPGSSAPATTFDDLLVACCAAAALAATALLWLTTTEVALGAWRSPARPARRTGPAGPLRSLLLAACGVAVLTSTSPALAASPDGHEPPTGTEVRHALDGLPLPDRADGAPAPSRTTAVVRAREGDNLWSIAATAVGEDAGEADLTAYWRRVVALHTATPGADPDLIRPGQLIRLPPS